jgi:hypothetical protein
VCVCVCGRTSHDRTGCLASFPLLSTSANAQSLLPLWSVIAGLLRYFSKQQNGSHAGAYGRRLFSSSGAESALRTSAPRDLG